MVCAARREQTVRHCARTQNLDVASHNPLRNMASGCVYGKLLSLNPAVDHIDLTRRETILGRSAPLCDVVFDDLQVSKQHCKIICSDAGVFIRDLRYDIALFHVVAMVRAVV